MLIDEALAILAKGQPLESCSVQGALTLTALSDTDDVRVPIVLRNVVLDSIQSPACEFHHPVVLDRVRIVG
jgi:hypothetical protein